MEVSSPIVSIKCEYVLIRSKLISKACLLKLTSSEEEFHKQNEIPHLEFKTYDHLLTQYCLNNLLLAFTQLQSNLENSKVVSLSELAASLGVHQKLRLFTYLLKQLEYGGYLSQVGGDAWRLLEPFPDPVNLISESEEIRSVVKASHPACLPFLDLCGKCCSNLLPVLQGKQDPNEYLFPANVLSLAGSTVVDNADCIYAGLPEVEWRDKVVQLIINALTQVNPSEEDSSKREQSVQVLEIGTARDGTTTKRILEGIDKAMKQGMHYEYTVTKPSSTYTRCNTNSNLPSNIVTKLFNIEYDPKDQGFIPKSYDLIIAINALHTSKNVMNCLANIQQLQKQDGIFILCERTYPNIALDLTFGLFNDWWRYEECDRAYPLLQTNHWVKCLQQAGYECLLKFSNPESIIVCRKRMDCITASVPTSKYPWIILSNEVKLRHALSSLLQGQVHEVFPTPSSVAAELYAGIICICDNGHGNGDVGPLEYLAQYLRGKERRRELTLQTKVVIVTTSKSNLYDNMTQSIARCLSSITQNGEMALTLVSLSNNEGDASIGRGSTRISLDDLDYEIFQEIWKLPCSRSMPQHLLFKGSELYMNNSHYMNNMSIQNIPATSADSGLIHHQEKQLRDINRNRNYIVILASETVETYEKVLERIDSNMQMALSLDEMLAKEGDKVAFGITYKLDENGSYRDNGSVEKVTSLIYDICRAHKLSTALHLLIFTSSKILKKSCGCDYTDSHSMSVTPPGSPTPTYLHSPYDYMLDSLDQVPYPHPLNQLLWFLSALTQFRMNKGLTSSCAFIVNGSDQYLPSLTLPSSGIFIVGWDFEINVSGIERVHEQDSGSSLISPLDGPTTTSKKKRSSSSASTSMLMRSISGSSMSGKLINEQSIREITLECLSSVSGLLPNEIEETVGFQEMGLDSIMILHLVDKLELAFEIELPVTALFDQPTVGKLIWLLQDIIYGHNRNNARRQSSFVSFEDNIAIIGASCHVGHANTLDGFWQLLVDGEDCIQEIPDTRFDWTKYEKEIYNHYGSFIENIDEFDCNFFQISPREAELIDPQHRLLLHLTWEALENGFIPAESLQGTRTGVFIGICTHDYKEVVEIPQDATGSYCVTLNLGSVAAGRISYFFGLEGPSMCIDTACSSSLVALHLACQSLLSGESKMAIVGGVNLILSPSMYMNYCKAKALSKGKVCRPFDNAADGMIRGEGGCVMVLKKLADAWSDGDNILGVIRGSGVNQDGTSAGLTAPNGHSQAQLIRRVLKKANLTPKDIGYVEAHGTGTALGDPVELNSLDTVFGNDSTNNEKRSASLFVGSVKANVGHLEGAAGITGLLKVCLALKHQQIPPQINFNVLNQHVTNQELFNIPKQNARWDRNQIGCVSSFGVSGTNAFVVVEGAPDYANSTTIPTTKVHHPYLVTISARTQNALLTLLAQYAQLSQRINEEELKRLAYTTNVGRTHFRYRQAFLVNNVQELRHQLSINTSASSPVEVSGSEIQICFIFTGQGSHYKGMGKDMYETQPYFRDVYDKCATHVQELIDKSICDVFLEDGTTHQTLDEDTIWAQAVLFSLEYSLAMYWIHIGVQPTLLIGHSLGEYVAAAVAHVVTLSDAIYMVVTRAQLICQQLIANQYGMMATTPESWVKINALNKGFSVSAVNSPGQIVISGPLSRLKECIKQNPSASLIMLNVPYGYHNPDQMKTISELFESRTKHIQFGKPKIPIKSTVTGKLITKDGEMNGAYWTSHLVSPVQFMEATKNAIQNSNCAIFLEIGPKPVLTNFVHKLVQSLGDNVGNIKLLNSMVANSGRSVEEKRSSGAGNSLSTILKGISVLYMSGFNFNFKEVYPYKLLKFESLPSYPFEYESCWSTKEGHCSLGRKGVKRAQAQLQSTDRNDSLPLKRYHPLTGPFICSTNDTNENVQIIYENQLRADGRTAYLTDHQYLGQIVLPGAAFVEMALSVANQTMKDKDMKEICLQNFIMNSTLVMETLNPVAVQSIMQLENSSLDFEGDRLKPKAKIKILSAEPSKGENMLTRWKLNASCILKHDFKSAAMRNGASTFSSLETEKRLSPCEPSLIWKHYSESRKKEAGVVLGSSFQQIKRLWVSKMEASNEESLSEIQLNDAAKDDKWYSIHPTILDSAFQTLFAILIVTDSSITHQPVVVSIIEEITFHRNHPSSASHVFAHVTNVARYTGGVSADISIYSSDNNILMEIRGFNAANTNTVIREMMPITDKKQHSYLKKLDSKIPAITSQLITEGTWHETWRTLPPRAPRIETKAISNILDAFEHRWRAPLTTPDPIEEELCAKYIAVALKELSAKYRLEIPFSSTGKERNAKVHEFCRHAGINDLKCVKLVQHWLQNPRIRSRNNRILKGEREEAAEEQGTLISKPLSNLIKERGENLADILQSKSIVSSDYHEAGLVSDLSVALANTMKVDMLRDLIEQISQVYAMALRGGGVGINILEIGAGSGNATTHVLHALRPIFGTSFTYTYTDISSSYFASFKDHDENRDLEIHFQILDIDRDPVTQGFVPFSYDLIIAANVLHVTRNCERALDNCRRLLMPGSGILALLETTSPSLLLDMTVGFMDAMWRFLDQESDPLRKDYPFLTAEEWREAMLDSNFGSVRYAECGDTSLIVANANGKYVRRIPRTSAPNHPWVVLSLDNRPGATDSIHTKLTLLLNDFGETVLDQQFSNNEDSFSSFLSSRLPREVMALVFDCSHHGDNTDGARMLLQLVQHILINDVRIHQKLMVITTNGTSSGNSNPWQALIWGMCKTIRTEHPELKCVSLDTETGKNKVTRHHEAMAMQIVQEMYTTDKEEMICFDVGGDRKVPRLTQILINSTNGKPVSLFSAEKTYLITGGLSDIALALAVWMHTEHGVTKFILLTRRSIRQLPITLQQLQLKHKLELEVIQCDVGDRARLSQVFENIHARRAQRGLVLGGIFHLATGWADGAVLTQTWDMMEHVYQAKVHGTWNLHQLTEKYNLNKELNHFVMFSSISSLIGNAGQINYCSANAFMDAMSHFRRMKGLPACTINWGVWAEIGQAATQVQSGKLPRGLTSFTPQMAFHALQFVLGEGHTQIALALWDWKSYDTRGSNWYTEVTKPDVQASLQPQHNSSTICQSSSMTVTLKELQASISEVVKNLTGFKQIQPDVLFTQLGLDSIMTINLRNRLTTMFDPVRIPMTYLFENPTVESLARKLLPQIAKVGSLEQHQELDTTTTTQLPNDKVVGNLSTAEQSRLFASRVRAAQSERAEESLEAVIGPRLVASKGPGSNHVQRSPEANKELKRERTMKRVSFENSTDDTAVQGSSAHHNGREDKTKSKDIAIIGMAARIGSCSNLEEYWKLLAEGRHSITRVPISRSELRKYFEADIPYGSFIHDHDCFDLSFFGIGLAEAKMMDPQHRILLEMSWHALEHAGIPPHSLQGSKTGVFIGMNGMDYSYLLANEGRNNDSPFLKLLGSGPSIAAGRISQFFGFEGPSLCVDTACSSTLVALHMAVQSLRKKETNLALVCGSNLLLSYEKYLGYGGGRMLSTDGKTRAYDAHASGWVRGEGVGVIVLKRLDAAVKSNKALAIVKGSCVRHAGLGSGLGAPSGSGQVQLFMESLQDARMSATDVDYVEGQGSASLMGDAIEMNALERVFGDGRRRRAKIIVGSSKPNVGHLEAGSALASIAKVVKSMEAKAIPSMLNLEELNPEIENPDFFEIPRFGRCVDWPSGNSMVAGVASMGYGGTNAFIIIQNAPKSEGNVMAKILPPPHLFPVSAKTVNSLLELAKHYSHLRLPNSHLANLAYSMTTTRSHFMQHRLAVVAETGEEFATEFLTKIERISSIRPSLPKSISLHFGGVVNLSQPLSLYKEIPAFKRHYENLMEASKGREMAAYLEGDTTADVHLMEFASQYLISLALIDMGLIPEKISGSGLIGELLVKCSSGQITLDNALRDLSTLVSNVSSAAVKRGQLQLILNGELASRIIEINNWKEFIQALAELFELNIFKLDLGLLYKEGVYEMVDLPLYPFERNKVWYK